MKIYLLETYDYPECTEIVGIFNSEEKVYAVVRSQYPNVEFHKDGDCLAGNDNIRYFFLREYMLNEVLL